MQFGVIDISKFYSIKIISVRRGGVKGVLPPLGSEGDKSEILKPLDLLWGQSKGALISPPFRPFLRERGVKPKYNHPPREARLSF